MSGSPDATAKRPQAMGDPVAAGATPRSSTDSTALVTLLRLEGEARECKSLDDLSLVIANETRKVTRAQQVFVLRPGIGGVWQVLAVSTLPRPDRTTPLAQAIERLIGAKRSTADGLETLARVHDFALHTDTATDTDDTLARYPFREALWLPLKARGGGLFAGALLLRTQPWTKSETVLAQRLSLAFAQSWLWLSTSAPPRRWFVFGGKRFVVCAGIVLLIALLPVSMTTLAPMEVVPRSPSVIAAPLDAVIEDIPVAPGQAVGKGAMLVRFVDTALRNRLEVAEREAEVALSRVKKTALLALSDLRSRHDLALARAEHAVKAAERDFARDLLSRTSVTASKPGVIMLGDKRDLIGRPVATGERLMDIADPSDVEIRIDVPVGDVIILSEEKRAKLFLDSAPLSPQSVAIVSSDYQARVGDSGQLSFRVIAAWPKDLPPPRLGARGTAQLYGDRVPFLWTVLRRPVAAMRQWIGL